MKWTFKTLIFSEQMVVQLFSKLCNITFNQYQLIRSRLDSCAWWKMITHYVISSAWTHLTYSHHDSSYGHEWHSPLPAFGLADCPGIILHGLLLLKDEDTRVLWEATCLKIIPLPIYALRNMKRCIACHTFPPYNTKKIPVYRIDLKKLFSCQFFKYMAQER